LITYCHVVFLQFLEGLHTSLWIKASAGSLSRSFKTALADRYGLTVIVTSSLLGKWAASPHFLIHYSDPDPAVFLQGLSQVGASQHVILSSLASNASTRSARNVRDFVATHDIENVPLDARKLVQIGNN
jgi:hypothetical protein